MHQSKSTVQDGSSPVAEADKTRKRQAQKVLSSREKIKARKSDSTVILQTDKPSYFSRTSIGDANVAGRHKTSSKGSRHSVSPALSKIGRKNEDCLRFISAERKRLEKENEEKKQRLEELKRQEMLIEAAAKKGGG